MLLSPQPLPTQKQRCSQIGMTINHYSHKPLDKLSAQAPPRFVTVEHCKLSRRYWVCLLLAITMTSKSESTRHSTSAFTWNNILNLVLTLQLHAFNIHCLLQLPQACSNSHAFSKSTSCSVKTAVLAVTLRSSSCPSATAKSSILCVSGAPGRKYEMPKKWPCATRYKTDSTIKILQCSKFDHKFHQITKVLKRSFQISTKLIASGCLQGPCH